MYQSPSDLDILTPGLGAWWYDIVNCEICTFQKIQIGPTIAEKNGTNV